MQTASHSGLEADRERQSLLHVPVLGRPRPVRAVAARLRQRAAGAAVWSGTANGTGRGEGPRRETAGGGLTSIRAAPMAAGAGRSWRAAPASCPALGMLPGRRLYCLVEPRGIEPLTFALRTRRSPSGAPAPCVCGRRISPLRSGAEGHRPALTAALQAVCRRSGSASLLADQFPRDGEHQARDPVRRLGLEVDEPGADAGAPAARVLAHVADLHLAMQGFAVGHAQGAG